MKQVNKIIIGCALLSTIFSCSVSKEAGTLKQKIKGNWLLQTINTEGIKGKITATVFNEAPFACFLGSAWYFNSNNSYGSYRIDGNGKDCSAISRSITWSIYEPNGAEKELQFKRMDDKKNPMDNNEGFRLHISLLDANTMQLRSTIVFENQPISFVYNFIKK